MRGVDLNGECAAVTHHDDWEDEVTGMVRWSAARMMCTCDPCLRFVDPRDPPDIRIRSAATLDLQDQSATLDRLWSGDAPRQANVN